MVWHVTCPSAVNSTEVPSGVVQCTQAIWPASVTAEVAAEQRRTAPSSEVMVNPEVVPCCMLISAKPAPGPVLSVSGVWQRYDAYEHLT